MSEKNIKNTHSAGIEKALAGEYTLDVNSILREAWQYTLQSRMSINIGLFFILLLGTFVSLIASNFMGGIEAVMEDPKSMSLLNILVTVVIWPFLAGIEMMGVDHAQNKNTRATMVFSFLQRGSWVALCALFTSVLISLGFQLLILPGIFLAVVLSLTIPLVVDKQLSPLQAIKISILSLRFKFFQLFRLYLLLFIALIALASSIALLAEYLIGPIAIVLFVFGMTFLAPLYYNVKGIVYREVFCEKEEHSVIVSEHDDTQEHNSDEKKSVNKANDSDDTFSA